VQIYPSDGVTRRTVTWDGMSAEIVQATRREKLEFRFHAPLHLLAVCDQGMRSEGETFVEGLPRSRLRDVTRKLTLVPAGHEYHEWHEPRVLTRIVYFYFDPAKMPSHSEAGVKPAPLAPRLFFEDAALSDTALKLKRLIENAASDSGPYFEALGTVLAHELVRLNAGASSVEVPAKGGLAPGSSARSLPTSRSISPRRYGSDRMDNFDPACLTLCSPDPQAIRPPDEKVNVLMVTLPTNFKVAKFDNEKGNVILRQLEKDIDAVRYDPGDGSKIELPVKLRGARLHFRAARQVVDAARRQLSLR